MCPARRRWARRATSSSGGSPNRAVSSGWGVNSSGCRRATVRAGVLPVAAVGGALMALLHLGLVGGLVHGTPMAADHYSLSRHAGRAQEHFDLFSFHLASAGRAGSGILSGIGSPQLSLRSPPSSRKALTGY